jgi:hypothetical protein
VGGLKKEKPLALAFAFLLLLAAVAAAITPDNRASLVGSMQDKPAGSNEASDTDIRTLCGTACHRLAPPDVLPRTAWRSTIVRMSLLRAGEVENAVTSAAHFSSMPDDMRRALAYYEARAPESLGPPEPWPAPDATRPPRFERRTASPPGSPPPGVAHVALLDIAGDAKLELVVSDMRHGAVLAHRPYVKGDGFVQLARIPHPAHAALTDVDRDGHKDLVVADLGSFLPSDHDRGSVVLLRGRPGFGPVAASRIATGLPRIAAVEPADFDRDGDVDLVVAAFGWRTTGSLRLLNQSTREGAAPAFETRLLDSRTGAIHAVPADLNGDARPDIVTLFAQEHESVVASINEGAGRFRQATIYAAPHPDWGSSGIRVVDLDRDGDLDVLLAHGDTFDDLIVKPYHGIQWLENRGAFPFVEHTLASLPGALRALPSDLDGDGDLDVLASAMIANVDGGTAARLASVVWLEQVARGEFRRHTLELGSPTHATMDAGDFDQDGDVDLVVGNFSAAGGQSMDWVVIWENRTK